MSDNKRRYIMIEQTMPLMPRDPIASLEYYAEKKPDDFFIIESTSNKAYTWSEMYRLVCRMDHYLQSSGCTPKDRIAVSCADELVTLVVGLACLKANIPFFLLPHHNSSNQKADTLAQVGAQFLFTDHDIRRTPGTQVIGLTRSALSAYGYEVKNNSVIDDESIGFFVLGSGTTGAPKLMEFSHRRIRSRVKWANSIIDITERTRMCVTVHLTFLSPFLRCLYGVVGGYSVVLGLTDVADFPDAVERYQITHMMSTVVQMEALVLAVGRSRKASFSSLEELVISYSTVQAKLLDAVKECITPHVVNGYGSNEVGSVTRLTSDILNPLPGSVGRPRVGSEIEIVDKDDQVLPAQARGRIRIKSPCMLDGYSDRSLPENADFRDGWFYCGDVGYFSADGQLIHLGRGDNLMIFNGVNIYPAEIEQALLKHPEVKDMAVMPVKHTVHQDLPACLVSLVAGAQVNAEDLRRFTVDLLGVKAPAFLAITHAIPRNTQGKIIRADVAGLISLALRMESGAMAPT